ncbi:MAG: hypothetical protein V4671_28430 [Armatimonadota bacterium]
MASSSDVPVLEKAGDVTDGVEERKEELFVPTPRRAGGARPRPGSVEFFEEKYPNLPYYMHEFMSIRVLQGEQAAHNFLARNDKPGIITYVEKEDGVEVPVLVNW